ncbi:MAG: hypothetical protein R3D27_07090 [Hyphomicrobiaceae bacterium]
MILRRLTSRTANAAVARLADVAILMLAIVVAATSLAAPRSAYAEKIDAVGFRATPGDIFKIAVEIEDRYLRDGSLAAHVKRRLAYDGRVVSLGPENDGFRIGWTLRSFASEILKDATGNQPLVLAGARSASQGFLNRELVFVANASGLPVRLDDWEAHKSAVAPIMRHAIEETISKAVLARRPDAKPEAVAAIAGRQADTLVGALVTRHDAKGAVALVEEATTIARVQGLGFQPGQPLVVSGSTSGPHTLGEVASTTTFKAMPRAGSEPLRIGWTTAFDTGALQEAAAAAIRRQLAAALAQIESEGIKAEVKRKFDEQIASIRVQRADTGESEIDPVTGWARRVVRRTLTETRQAGIPTERRERVVTIAVSR